MLQFCEKEGDPLLIVKEGLHSYMMKDGDFVWLNFENWLDYTAISA